MVWALVAVLFVTSAMSQTCDYTSADGAFFDLTPLKSRTRLKCRGTGVTTQLAGDVGSFRPKRRLLLKRLLERQRQPSPLQCRTHFHSCADNCSARRRTRH